LGRTTVIFCHRVFGADAGGVRAPGARSCRPLSCSHRKGMHASTACGASVRLTAAGKLGRTHRPFPPRRRYVGGVSVPSPHRPREDEPTLQTLQDPIQGAHLGFAFELAFQTHWVSAFQLRQGAAERRHATGRVRMSPPPPCRHFKIQSCCGLGSAFELAAFRTLAQPFLHTQCRGATLAAFQTLTRGWVGFPRRQPPARQGYGGAGAGGDVQRTRSGRYHGQVLHVGGGSPVPLHAAGGGHRRGCRAAGERERSRGGYIGSGNSQLSATSGPSDTEE
jgi:hypothetical protein